MSGPTEQAIIELVLQSKQAQVSLKEFTNNTAAALREMTKDEEGNYTMSLKKAKKHTKEKGELLKEEAEFRNKHADAETKRKEADTKRHIDIQRAYFKETARLLAKEQRDEINAYEDIAKAKGAINNNTSAQKKVSRSAEARDEHSAYMQSDALHNSAEGKRQARETARRNDRIRAAKEQEQLNEKQLGIDAAQAKIRSGIEDRRAREAIGIQQRYYHEQAKEEAKRLRGAGQIDLSRAGRVGAGLATMSGNYQMAGGLYAASNMLDAMAIKIPVVGAAVLGVTAALAVGGVAFLSYGEALNKDLAAMSTLLLPATSGTEELHMAMEKATNSAVKLSNTFNVDLNDVIKGYKDALSSGIDANDLDRFGRASAILSTALGESFGSTTQILTTFKDTYKLTMGEMEGIGDKLFNVVDVGRVNSKQMLDNLGRLIPVAKTAGITVTDMLGAFSTLTRTMTVSQATTSLGRAIEGIISPSKDSILAFNELGIAYGSAAFVGRSLAEVIKDIRDKTGAEGEILNRLFPNVQMQRGIAQLSTQLELLDKNTKAIDVSNTAIVAANRAQDTLGTNLAKVWTGIVNSIETAASTSGTWWNSIGKKAGAFQDPDKEEYALNGGFAAFQAVGMDPTKLTDYQQARMGIGKNPVISPYEALGFGPDRVIGADGKVNADGLYYEDSSPLKGGLAGKFGEWNTREAMKTMEANKAKYGGALNTGISAQRELMSDEAGRAKAKLASDRQTDIQIRLTEAQKDEYKRLVDLKNTSLATDAAQGNAFADKTFAEHFKKVDLYRDGEPGGVGNKFDLEKEFKELNDAVVKYRAGLGANTKLLQAQLKAFEDGILTQRESKDIKEELTAAARVSSAEDRIDRQARREAISIKIKALREEAAAASKEARANDSKIKAEEEKIKDPRKLKAGERLNGDRGVVALLEADKAAYAAAVVKVNEIKDAIAELTHESKAIGNETAQDIIDNKGAKAGSGSGSGSGASSGDGGATSVSGSGAGTYRDGTNFHSGGVSGAGYVKEGPRGANQKNRGKLSPENQKYQDARDARYDAELGIMRKKAVAETELVGNALSIIGDKVTIHTTSMVNDVVKGWGIATVAFLNYSAAVQSGLASMKTIGDTSNSFHIDIQNSGGGKTDTDALAREVKIKVDKAEANNILKSDYGSKNKPPLATTGGRR